MSNVIDAINAEQMQGKTIPDFGPGDTVLVQVKVKEGARERLQAFEGVVIARRNRGLNSAFTVRKIDVNARYSTMNIIENKPTDKYSLWLI